ncbi:hypothetical protein J4G37_14205 [Microvirga sp. 3-52]|nr:hypothetical protein [Microvirga sp. 3-52]
MGSAGERPSSQDEGKAGKDWDHRGLLSWTAQSDPDGRQNKTLNSLFPGLPLPETG